MTDKMGITLSVNGMAYPISVEPRRTLADALREDCRLTGTHLGCEHGVCGACTVIVDGRTVRSCLMFAVQAEGVTIRTVEGLADGETLHPLQQAFWENHGLQCGFCTPGFLMLAAGALEASHRSATTICVTSCRPISADAQAIRTSSRPFCWRRKRDARHEFDWPSR